MKKSIFQLDYWLSIVLGVAGGILSFFTEQYFKEGEPQQLFTYYSSKFILVIYIFTCALFLIKFFKKLLKKDLFYRRWGKNLLYFAIPCLLFLIIAWPGYFVWDEFWVYECASRFILDNWQAYFTVYYYLIHLYIFPSIGTIVLFQILLFSFVCSWVLTKIDFSYTIKYRWVNGLFFLLLLLSPAIMVNAFMTYRSSPIAVLELWLCALLFFSAREQKITNRKLWTIVVLTVLLSVWRQEGIYHLVAVPLFLWCFLRQSGKKRWLAAAVIILTGYFVCTSLYSVLMNQGAVAMRYQLTAYMNPLSNILANKDSIVDERSVAVFDKVIDVDKTKSLAYIYETPSFWEGAVREGFTKAQFKDFKGEFWKVALSNKDIFLAARIQTMLGASGLSDKGYYPKDAIYTYLQDNSSQGERVKNTLDKKLNQPLNKSFRKVVYQLLNESLKYKIVFWNFIPILTFLLIIFIKEFNYRNALTWILFILLARIPILILLEPGSYFMYYYPMILSGVFFVFIYVVEKINRTLLKGERDG